MAKKEATFKLNVDSGDAVKDVKELDKDMTHLADTIGVEVSGSISAMEDRLYELALAGEQNSKEFKQLQEQTAKYKQIVIETDRSIDALAEQGRGLSSALSLAEGTVAGFQAFTGVTALMGNENEELLETITKLQAAQGVLNSIEVIKQQLQNNSIKLTQAQGIAHQFLNKAIGNGSKAMKVFRGALLATGIGAIIAGVALLVEHWDDLTNAIMGTSKAQRTANQITDEAIEAAAEELSALDKLSKTINNEKLSREEKNKAVEDLQSAYPNLLQNIDAEKVSIDDLNEAIQANVDLTILKAKADATAALRVEAYKQQIQAQIEIQRGAEASTMDYVQSFLSLGDASAQAALDQAQLAQESQEQIAILDDLSSGYEEQIGILEKKMGIDKESQEASKAADEARKARLEELRRQEEELNNARLLWAQQQNDILDMIAQAEEDATTSAIQKELNAVNEKYFELITRAEEFGLETATLKEAQEAELLAIENRYGAESYARQQQLEQAKSDLTTERINLQIDAMKEGQEKEIAELEQSFVARRTAIIESEALTYAERLPLLMELEEQEQLAIQEIRDRYREEEKAKEAEASQQRTENINNYLNAAMDVLQAIADFQELQTDRELTAVDEEYDAKLKAAEGDKALTEKLEKEKDAKKNAIEKAAFERGKKLQIAMAVIQGIQGVMAAFTAGSSMGPAGIVMGPLMAALAAVAAGINIAKISSQKFEGSSSAGAGASAGSYSGVASAGANASSFVASDNTSSATTDLNPNGSVATPTEESQPVQVFVTETDISETQNNVNQIEVKSTF